MSARPPLQLILTGANGTLGIPLVHSLLQQSPQLHMLCILRTQTSCDELAATLSAVERARIEFLVVDICDDGAMAAAADRRPRLSSALGIHLAADVSWDKSCEDMSALNVGGSDNFCRFLLRQSDRPALIYVSTAYTQVENWEYRNGYEESKAMAERLLRATYGERISISTFSCSLVVGDSRTGAISRFNGLYPLIRFMAGFSPPFLVGNKTGLLDIVPLDWVVDELRAMILRFAASDVAEQVVASAGDSRISYENLVRLVESQLSEAREMVGLGAQAPVPILKSRQWDFLKRSLSAWSPEGISKNEFRYFERLLNVYGVYASSDRVRPPLNVSRSSPDPVEFLPQVIKFWLQKNPRAFRSGSRMYPEAQGAATGWVEE
ncbi:SDR family oxidoreductase [Pseudomonas syringae pv. syringae]|uniref:SDR family oxidoreductase n=1 Tax=Pseudomonas syringae TaxID=317 RepID=UPI003A718608